MTLLEDMTAAHGSIEETMPCQPTLALIGLRLGGSL